MPPNLFLVAKAFTSFSGQDRFENVYHYDGQPIIGPTQRTHLAAALERCRRAIVNESTWIYIPEDADGRELAPEEKLRYPIAEYDALFWTLLLSADGPSRVLDRILAPLGRCTRLFCESVLTTGSLFINYDPFRRGDLGWITPVSSIRSRDLVDEHLRLACLHYVLLLIAPPARTPSLLMMPLRVGGAAWLAAITIRASGSSDQRPSQGGSLVADEWFQRSYIFYHTLMRGFERRLRRKSKACYIEHVGEIVGHYVRAFRNAEQEGTQCQPQTLVDQINHEISDLCRVYPYQRIVFWLDKPSESARDPILLQSEHPLWHPLWFTLEPNVFFDRLDMEWNLKRDEVRDDLWSVVRGELSNDRHLFA